MIVKCPVCDAEYDLASESITRCKCGAKFRVLPDGATTTVDRQTTDVPDADRTITPCNTHDDTAKGQGTDFDPDKTIPDGRLEPCSDSAAALGGKKVSAAVAGPGGGKKKILRAVTVIVVLAVAAVVAIVAVVAPSSGDLTIQLPGGVKLEMVKVKAGEFMMSARDGENECDEVQHIAKLTRDFHIGRTEVTQAQWRAVMGNNPSHWKDDDLPVECVSWHDAMKFCEKLNSMGKAPPGYKFTLPTETQWEYAARGGRKSRGFKYSGSNDIGEVAWYCDNSGGRTRPVGTKRANELGLCDMSGNVCEWCLDDWNRDSGKAVPEFARQ